MVLHIEEKRTRRRRQQQQQQQEKRHNCCAIIENRKYVNQCECQISKMEGEKIRYALSGCIETELEIKQTSRQRSGRGREGNKQRQLNLSKRQKSLALKQTNVSIISLIISILFAFLFISSFSSSSNKFLNFTAAAEAETETDQHSSVQHEYEGKSNLQSTIEPNSQSQPKEQMEQMEQRRPQLVELVTSNNSELGISSSELLIDRQDMIGEREDVDVDEKKWRRRRRGHDNESINGAKFDKEAKVQSRELQQFRATLKDWPRKQLKKFNSNFGEIGTKLVSTTTAAAANNLGGQQQQQQQEGRTNETTTIKNAADSMQQQQPSRAVFQGDKKLNSLVLKKLLQKSLPKSAANNDHSSQSNNFKFVFIQRATAAPQIGSTGNSTRGPKNVATKGSIDHSDGISGKFSYGEATKHQSLAASVSKQLANSLMYSAANLIGNLTATGATNAVPSLTALISPPPSSTTTTTAAQTTQTTGSGSSSTGSGGTTISSERPNNNVDVNLILSEQQVKNNAKSNDLEKKLENKNDDLEASAANLNEIKRSSRPAATATTLISINKLNDNNNNNSRKSGQTTMRRIANKSNRPSSATRLGPSKIYNLPLKFVANGQVANSVVILNTIRQHFSMIKKLQQNGTNNNNSSSSIKQFNNQQTKRKQQQQHSNGIKLKGNSRLIYLPLKYLSNAKPNMLQVIATRASHKSTNVRH